MMEMDICGSIAGNVLSLLAINYLGYSIAYPM
jgi:hypothetical protein